jgi:beta-N-acetylhexosaminidase
MATIGRSGDADLAESFARAVGAELRAVGITLDYAPVLDVNTNPANPVIGDRALSEDADEVARLGAAIVRGLQAAGVAACGKHFPGHGDTSADSHLELPLVEHPIERLRDVEFKPFRAAIDAGVTAIMTAHLFLPALDEQRPATLSRRIVSGLLRDELSFGGVVLSDDLEMKAIGADRSVPEAAVLAVEAGCDGLLICGGDHDLHVTALEALIHATENEQLPVRRVEDALRRQRLAKERMLSEAVSARPLERRRIRDLVGIDRHRAIAAQMARFL